METCRVAINLVPDDGFAEAGSGAVLHVPEEALAPEVPHEGPHQQTRHVPLDDLPVAAADGGAG